MYLIFHSKTILYVGYVLFWLIEMILCVESVEYNIEESDYELVYYKFGGVA